MRAISPISQPTIHSAAGNPPAAPSGGVSPETRELDDGSGDEAVDHCLQGDAASFGELLARFGKSDVRIDARGLDGAACERAAEAIAHAAENGELTRLHMVAASGPGMEAICASVAAVQDPAFSACRFDDRSARALARAIGAEF